MVKKKILIVDDDETLRSTVSEQLELHEEYATVQAATAAEGMDCVKEGYFDAILLDVGLPDMDGRDLCRLMRRNGVKPPIIMLTAMDSDADTILGLDAGAHAGRKQALLSPSSAAVALAEQQSGETRLVSDNARAFDQGADLRHAAQDVPGPEDLRQAVAGADAVLNRNDRRIAR